MIYFNELDAYPAQWLANLYPEAHTDQRSISDVTAADVDGFTRAHFFAGIGGWEYALQLAGWPSDRPVWTGSCPCQPFSAAGKQAGESDPRHLWPEFRRLIAERRPATVFGEQVASKLGRAWLAGVRADLEALGYAVGAADLCAAGVGAPHIRQRLYWVADAQRHAGEPGWAADEPRGGATSASTGPHAESGRCGDVGGLGHSNDPRPQGRREHVGEYADQRFAGPSGVLGAWDGATWLPCLDGKARRVEPGTFPLAHGVPGRVGRLRAYGNAIVPQQAAAFVRAFLEAEHQAVSA